MPTRLWRYPLPLYVPSADRGGYVAYETPRDNSQPGTPSKIVSTLLEILDEGSSATITNYTVKEFQPFLRFWANDPATMWLRSEYSFQPFLRFYTSGASRRTDVLP